MYKKITKCRICGNPELTPLLDLGEQNLTGVFPKTKKDSMSRDWSQLGLQTLFAKQ